MTADREARAREVLAHQLDEPANLHGLTVVDVEIALRAMLAFAADTHRAALAEGRAQGMREAAGIAERCGCSLDSNDHIVEAIRQQIASNASGGEGA